MARDTTVMETTTTTRLFTRTGHLFEGAPLFTETGRPYTIKQEACRRCGGAGGSSAWVATGWTCYDCGGNGRGRERMVRLYTVEQNARLDAVAAKRAERVAKRRAAMAAALDAEMEAARAAFEQQHAALLARAAAATGDSLIDDIVTRGRDRAALSDKQLAFLARLLDERDAKAAAAATSAHVGAEGDRVALDLTVLRRASFSRPSFSRWNQSETVWVVTYADADGNQFVVKSPSWGWDAEPGDRVSVKATIKAHGEWEGVKQTVLQRVKEVAQ